ncbi:hypothetical protein EAE96_003161 [Botrytis aclada]|nr:hypothetical protein EAE96_003161 [Botrytis aclada]
MGLEKRIYGWSRLPLDATLLKALRISRGLRPPTPIQVATIHSFSSSQKKIFLQAPFFSGKTMGYVVPIVNEALLAHLEKLTGNDTLSSVLKPTALVILPTNTLAVQVKAMFDKLLAVLNGRLNHICPDQVRPNDIALKYHKAYNEILWG